MRNEPQAINKITKKAIANEGSLSIMLENGQSIISIFIFCPNIFSTF